MLYLFYTIKLIISALKCDEKKEILNKITILYNNTLLYNV